MGRWRPCGKPPSLRLPQAWRVAWTLRCSGCRKPALQARRLTASRPTPVVSRFLRAAVRASPSNNRSRSAAGGSGSLFGDFFSDRCPTSSSTRMFMPMPGGAGQQQLDTPFRNLGTKHSSIQFDLDRAMHGSMDPQTMLTLGFTFLDPAKPSQTDSSSTDADSDGDAGAGADPGVEDDGDSLYGGSYPDQARDRIALSAGASTSAAAAAAAAHPLPPGWIRQHRRHPAHSSSPAPAAAQPGHLSPTERRNLTLDIINCKTWEQLRTLVSLHADQLDHVHVSATLVKLAKLVTRAGSRGGSDPRLFALVEELCGRVPEHMPRLGPREASNMLWALAVLAPRLTAAARPRQPVSGPSPPGAAAADVFRIASVRASRSVSRPATARSSRPLNAATQPSDAAGRSPAACALAAAMREARRLCGAMQQLWDAASPQALSNTIWASARLELRPADAWLQGFLGSSLQLLSSFRPQELSSTLWALASLRIWPGRPWLVAAVAACRAGLPAFGPQALANAAWALVRLRAPLPPTFLQQLAAACLEKLPESQAAEAARGTAAGSSAAEGVDSGSAGTQAEAAAAAGGTQAPEPQRLPPSFLQPRQLTMILWALAAHQRQQQSSSTSPAPPHLSFSPPPPGQQRDSTAALVSAAALHMEPLLCSMPAQALATGSWALARLGYVPRAAWQAKLMTAAAGSSAQLSSAGLCQLLWALARWSASPDPTWIQGLTSGPTARLPRSMTLRELTDVALACARLGARPAPAFTHALVAALGPHLTPAACSPHAAAELCWALGELRVWPGARWVMALTRLCLGWAREQAGGPTAMSPAQVARMLGGLARMPARAAGNNAAAREPSGCTSTSGAVGAGLGQAVGQPHSDRSSSSSSSSSGGSLPPVPRPAQLPYVPARLVHSLMSQAVAQATGPEVGHLAEAAWAATQLRHPPPAEALARIATLAAGPAGALLSARAALYLLCALAAAAEPVALPPPRCGRAAAVPPPHLAARVCEQLLFRASTLDPTRDIPLLLSLMTGGILARVAAPTGGSDAGRRRDGDALEANEQLGHVVVSGHVVCMVVSAALHQDLPRLPALQLTALVSAAAAAGFAPSPAWGAAVEAATRGPLALPAFGGISAPARTSLLGALLFSGHRPAQPWLDAWCGAVGAGGARGLSPPQLLAALRLAASSTGAPAGLHLPPSFLAQVEASALSSARPFAAGHPHPASAAALESWGPAKLIALSAHLLKSGHAPSPELHAAAERALTLHLTPPAGSASSPAALAPLLTAVLELAHLPARRCGAFAAHTTTQLLRHVAAAPPEAVLDAVLTAAAAAAAPPRDRLPDPLAPFYAALSIRAPSARGGAAAAPPGRLLCVLLEMLASWGVTPSEAWLSAVVSGACSRSAAAAALPLSGPHAFSLLKSLALIQSKVSGQCVEQILGLLTPRSLQECSSKQVAEVSWALGALQYRPPHSWWEGYESVLLSPTLSASSPSVTAAEAGQGRSRGSSAWAAGDRPSLPSSSPPTAAAAAAPSLLQSMAGKQLCEVAWACAALRLTPSTPLLTGLASAAAGQLPSLDPASLSNLLWSLYVLDEGGPGPAWMDLWLSEAAGKLPAFEAQDLALAISGLAAAAYRPRQEWLGRFLVQAHAKARQCRGVQLLRILYSLAELDCRPEPAWLQHFADAARLPAVARELDTGAYGQLAWAFDRLSQGQMAPAAFLPPALLARMEVIAEPGTASGAGEVPTAGRGEKQPGLGRRGAKARRVRIRI